MLKGSGPLRKREVIAGSSLLLLQMGRLKPSEGKQTNSGAESGLKTGLSSSCLPRKASPSSFCLISCPGHW